MTSGFLTGRGDILSEGVSWRTVEGASARLAVRSPVVAQHAQKTGTPDMAVQIGNVQRQDTIRGWPAEISPYQGGR